MQDCMQRIDAENAKAGYKKVIFLVISNQKLQKC
jgi:hypothetical protein